MGALNQNNTAFHQKINLPNLQSYAEKLAKSLTTNLVIPPNSLKKIQKSNLA